MRGRSVILGLVAAGAALGASGLASSLAHAEDTPKVAVTIKDHHFSPAEIHVPAGKPVELEIANQDPTPEEFDSSALKVEKVIAGGKTGVVRLRPLDAGRYPFIGEYHAATAKGAVVAD